MTAGPPLSANSCTISRSSIGMISFMMKALTTERCSSLMSLSVQIVTRRSLRSAPISISAPSSSLISMSYLPNAALSLRAAAATLPAMVPQI